MQLANLTPYLEESWAQLTIGLLALIIVSWLAYFLVNLTLKTLVFRFLGIRDIKNNSLNFSFIKRLAQIVPALIISIGITQVPHLHADISQIIINVANAFIVLALALTITGILGLVNQLYERRPESHSKPIKGYIEVVKIVIYALSAILVVAALFDKSPLILLSGLGALAAVLMLVFQDTILSLVASIQISTNDIIRVGDWVEMPHLNADGDVIDIALHTVKVQNFDKTITTIPTRKFISDSFKNWRGMQESGGRRIKRSLMIDQNTIGFLSEEKLTKLRDIKLLRTYLANKKQEIEQWNAKIEVSDQVYYQRNLTNLGTFRFYVAEYLKHHSQIHKDFTNMVRHLQPTDLGLPLEIYCFSNTVDWVEYENIQADIFEHLMAIAPEFGLNLFQSPSGSDFANLRFGK